MTTPAALSAPQPLAAHASRQGVDNSEGQDASDSSDSTVTSDGADTSDSSAASDASACQAAAHATRLAIMRWRLGQPQAALQVAAALRATVQERWYAQTLHQLDAWRASGGFGKDSLHIANGQ